MFNTCSYMYPNKPVYHFSKCYVLYCVPNLKNHCQDNANIILYHFQSVFGKFVKLIETLFSWVNGRLRPINQSVICIDINLYRYWFRFYVRQVSKQIKIVRTDRTLNWKLTGIHVYFKCIWTGTMLSYQIFYLIWLPQSSGHTKLYVWFLSPLWKK